MSRAKNHIQLEIDHQDEIDYQEWLYHQRMAYIANAGDTITKKRYIESNKKNNVLKLK